MSHLSALQNFAFPGDDKEPQLNAYLRQPIWVDTSQVSWSGSPAEGVLRKRLELIGEDTPQLTTVVQFAPGSEFPLHTHDGGEEFFVLSGVFSDANGDYLRGCYVRNPVGSRHAPYTLSGCTLLVKLRQFQPQDVRQCVINTRSNEGVSWVHEGNSTFRLDLHRFGEERVMIYRMESESRVSSRRYVAGVEIYLIDGVVEIGEQRYRAGSWLRFPPGVTFEVTSQRGAEMYVKEGPCARFEQDEIHRRPEAHGRSAPHRL